MLLAAFGCSDSPNTITLEVYSWWDDPEERKAFDNVARLHGQTHESVQVENLRNSSMNARRELSQRMLTDAPPATFQANVGADLLRWAMVDTQDDFEGDVRARPDDTLVLIAELTSFYEEELGGKVPDEVDSMLRLGVQAAPLAVPINIHRLNVLYYNKKNVDAYVDPEGRDLFHIDTLCPETDKPPLAVTIAAPLTDEWTLVLFVFENLLPALIERERKRDPAFDPDFYDRLFTGKEPGERLPGGESVLVKKALECAKYLSASFSNAGRWPDAVDDVADGTATFTVMGDWANALLKEELRDEIVIPITFPGTEDLYVYTSDTFPLPVGVEYRSEALELLKTFANRDAQVKFSELKGSIPARLDTGFVSPRGWSTTAQFQDPEIRKLLATSGYFPPYYPLRQLWARLRDMLPSTASAAAIDTALREFTNSEKLLGRWQRRLEEGAARTTTMTTPEP